MCEHSLGTKLNKCKPIICNKDGTGNHCVQSSLSSSKQTLHGMGQVESKNHDPMDMREQCWLPEAGKMVGGRDWKVDQ